MCQFFTNHYILSDMFYQGYEKLPRQDTFYGGSRDIEDEEFEILDDGLLRASFLRRYNTGDEFDKILTPGTLQPCYIAWNEGIFETEDYNKALTTMTIPAIPALPQF